MGQTKQEDFAVAASTASRPLNFAAGDFSFQGDPSNQSNTSNQSPSTSPHKDQSGRPSTPFPENEVQLQFVSNHNNAPTEQPMENPVHNMTPSGAPDAMGAVPCMVSPNAQYHMDSHQHQQRPSFLMQQQSWPAINDKTYYSQSLDISSTGAVHRTNPFAIGQRSASCDASPTCSHATPSSPVDKEERIPNSAARRSRVWKYGRRSSGSHGDRQPFTFSVAATQAGELPGMDSRNSRFFGKRAFSVNDESRATEPSPKQFISEERMTAEMHNLSLDGFPGQSVFPLHSSSSPTSPPPHTANLPSTSVGCNHGNSLNLLRHHQCQGHHHPRSRTYAEVVLANIERRLEDDSDDEGVEEDMPPSQGEGHRLEMTPQLVSALKAKGSANYVLPHDIVKKIATSPCMELVLWRPPSAILTPRIPQESGGQPPPSSPSSSGSELTPIMEVELERERAEASATPRHPLYHTPAGVDGMQEEETLPDFDEDMDL